MRAVITLVVLIGTAGAAWAGTTSPVIVIPGRPGVPVIINGVDASYAVVEGDWGLGKGIHVQPTVYGGHPVDPGPPVGHYYPSAGHAPGYGRLEIESAAKPKPAPSFHQSWSAGSSQADPPAPPVPLSQVPPYPPPVIVAPQFNERDRDHRFQQNSAVPPQNPTSPLISPAPQPEVRDQRGPQHRPVQ